MAFVYDVVVHTRTGKERTHRYTSQLEHALAAREERLPDAAAATFTRAEKGGLALELVALEPGEEPDWDDAERYLDALVLEEIEDDLLEQCGVNPGADPRETWLDKVKERLRSDLARFRDDIEGDHDEIEEWDFRDGRIFASVGSTDDEADPDSGHGWMCRLVDAGVLGAAGFDRVRKASLVTCAASPRASASGLSGLSARSVLRCRRRASGSATARRPSSSARSGRS